MQWRVCKTVTEHYYFVVEAESEQEAMDIVSDDDVYHCDLGMCDDLTIDVQGAVEVTE